MSLEKLKRYRLQTIKLVTPHLRIFWRRIIATSKVVQLFSTMYLWSAFTNSSFISYNYSLKHKFWLTFYKWKCVAGKWPASILSLLQFTGCSFGICIKKYCQFTEIGPTSNWPMCLPKYQENVIQGSNMKWKKHKREDKISYRIPGHLFSEWLLVMIAGCKAFSHSPSLFILIMENM